MKLLDTIFNKYKEIRNTPEFAKWLLKLTIIVAFLAILIDTFIPMFIKLGMILGWFSLHELGLDLPSLFRIVPEEAYNYLNFLVANMAGLYGFQTSNNTKQLVELDKIKIEKGENASHTNEYIEKDNTTPKFSIRILKNIVYLFIFVLLIDMLVPILMRKIVVSHGIKLEDLGIDSSKFFRVIPSGAYLFLSFLVVTACGLVGWRANVDSLVKIANEKFGTNLQTSESILNEKENTIQTDQPTEMTSEEKVLAGIDIK